MTKERSCKYCFKPVVLLYAEWLTCNICNHNVHLSCLKRQSTPGGLHGDIFFKYTCAECTENNTEVFNRDKMTWFKVIIVALYHLQYKSAGTAKNGFFHWKTHLVNFIDRKWNILFPKDFKRRKNWMGTVSGSLSHFSPSFLTSGIQILGESGWWRLTYPTLTPSIIVSIHNQLLLNKPKSSKIFDDSYVRKLVSQYISIKEEVDEETIIQTKEDSIMNEPILSLNLLDEEILDSTLDLLHHDYQISDHINDLFSILDTDESCLEKEVRENSVPSLFAKCPKSNFYNFWHEIEPKNKAAYKSDIVPMRPTEEHALLEYLQRNDTNRSTHALKRKLIVRLIKHERRLRKFNIDNLIKLEENKTTGENNMFCHYKTYPRICSDRILLVSGNTEFNDYLSSPYTNRILKPYIRRDVAPTTIWLRLMSELQYRINNQSLPLHSLDYCYVRPNHIPAINSLCEQFFWPGIDCEALEYPDFSCVVIYKKLVVGFAFMVPDVKFNETYISFIFTRPEWRRSGIASFMIYHLIQTCMGKDITLHVAIDNPAIFLYQKFGFKVEEVVLNFYDTYLREDSNQCKHAYFLRLER